MDTVRTILKAVFALVLGLALSYLLTILVVEKFPPTFTSDVLFPLMILAPIFSLGLYLQLNRGLAELKYTTLGLLAITFMTIIGSAVSRHIAFSFLILALIWIYFLGARPNEEHKKRYFITLGLSLALTISLTYFALYISLIPDDISLREMEWRVSEAVSKQDPSLCAGMQPLWREKQCRERAVISIKVPECAHGSGWPQEYCVMKAAVKKNDTSICDALLEYGLKEGCLRTYEENKDA